MSYKGKEEFSVIHADNDHEALDQAQKQDSGVTHVVLISEG